MNPPARVAEFFCGIGGLHFALEWAGFRRCEVLPYDIGVHTNLSYAHSFGRKPFTTPIDRLDAKALDKLDSDLWLLSPPCQPYVAFWVS